MVRPAPGQRRGGFRHHRKLLSRVTDKLRFTNLVR